MSSAEAVCESPYRPPRISFRKQPESDDEYVERMRQQLQTLDRWRWWLIAPHLTVVATGTILSLKAFEVLQSVSTWVPASMQTTSITFAFGILCGAGFGSLMILSVFGIGRTLFGQRQLRLLIRYHDEAQGS